MIRPMNYLGLDVHKRTISYCVRSSDGTILQEGSVTALREELDELLAEVPAPCVVGLESTLFTAWLYDHLTAKGISVKVAHPAMLKGDLCGKAEE
jgi:transposase